jgi:hypothetical protein
MTLLKTASKEYCSSRCCCHSGSKKQQLEKATLSEFAAVTAVDSGGRLSRC